MKSADMISPYIMIHLMCSVILMATALFLLDLVLISFLKDFLFLHQICISIGIYLKFQQFKHIDYDIILVIIMIGAATLSLFVYCFFGKLATTSFEEMANCTYESNWQQLRVDLQTYLILMIGNMQRPIYYHGFGVAVLNLETFCKVTKNYFNFEKKKIN